MSMWGTSSTDRSKPKYLKVGSQFSPDNCYATPRGWVYKHLDGREELLVAISGGRLTGASGLGAAQITQVYWAASTFAADATAAGIVVVFTEEITVTSGAATISVTSVSGRAGSPFTFTYASGSGTNKLLFTADLSAIAGIAGESLTFVGQTIGATDWVDKAEAGVTDVAFASGDRVGAGGDSATYAPAVVTGGTIIAVAFGAAAYADTDTATVKVKWNQNVALAATPKTITDYTAAAGDVVFDCAAHGFQVGEFVTVAGITPVAANGTFEITSKTNDTFTVTLADPTAYVSGGTAVGVATVTLTQTTVGDKKMTYVSGTGTDTLTFSLDLTGWGVATKDLQIAAQTLALPAGVTIKVGTVAADLAFASGDRTDPAMTGAYADITLT